MEFTTHPEDRDLSVQLPIISPDVCQQLRDARDRLHETFKESVTAYEIEMVITQVVGQFLRALQLRQEIKDIVFIPVSDLEEQAIAELMVIEAGARPLEREAMIRGENARKKAHVSDAA
jgi:hypothetical protein